ncbi:MAG: arginase family protein [Dehalococcoidia bacterium]
MTSHREGSTRPGMKGVGTYPFVGIPTFLRAETCKDLDDLNADIAILGAPTDEGSPFLPGSRFGPRSIREHSMRFGGRGFYNPQERKSYLEYELRNKRIVDVGDATVLPTNAELTFQNITDLTRAVLDKGAMPVVLGGDHAITFPVVRAYGEPLYVMHFDAHIDYSPFEHGFEYTNGHAMRHIHHLDNVQGITQIGIRSLRSFKSDIDDSVDDGNRVVTMEQFREIGHRALVEELPAEVKCYVSIDIDVLDLPLVPGCVSAEPGGMTYEELRETLIVLAEHTDVVGFDLVEVNPELDVGTGITSYLAAHTILEFLGWICDQPRWIARRETR